VKVRGLEHLKLQGEYTSINPDILRYIQRRLTNKSFPMMRNSVDTPQMHA